MTWLLLGFMNFNRRLCCRLQLKKWWNNPVEFPAAFFGANFRSSLLARWIHGKTQPARFSHEVGISHLPIFLLRKKSGEQGKKRPGCLGYISEQWTLGTCNLQDGITLVRPVVTDLERDPNGDSYEGEFKNGKKHGNGKMLWDDGQLWRWMELIFKMARAFPQLFFGHMAQKRKREAKN